MAIVKFGVLNGAAYFPFHLKNVRMWGMTLFETAISDSLALRFLLAAPNSCEWRIMTLRTHCLTGRCPTGGECLLDMWKENFAWQ